MKLILVLCLGLSLNLNAQTSARELEIHRKLVEESKLNSTGIESLDTFICKGKPTAFVEVFERDSLLSVTGQSIVQLSSGLSLIIVSRIMKTASENLWSSYLFSFPTLRLICEVKTKSGPNDIFETICEFGLFNGQYLDTGRVETFVVLKGGTSLDNLERLEKTKDTVILEKAIVVNRNKNGKLEFIGENILQDAVMIGSIKESIIEGPNGPLHKISIFNSIGALICTAAATGVASLDWRLLTFKDNKFHSISCTFGNDKKDIIKYLIKQGFF